MRIAFVSPLFPNPAEPFRGAYNFKLVESLRKLAEVEVYSPRATLPLRHSMRPYATSVGAPVAIPVTMIPYPSLPFVSRPLNWLATELRVLPFLARSRPDMVLGSWVHPEGYGVLRASARLRIPFAMQALGTDLRRVPDAFARRIVGKSMRQSRAVITVSRELKEWAVRYGADPARVFPVLNGSDPAVFYPRERPEMRARLGLRDGIELVLFVGNLIPTKGVNELLDAVHQLLPARPNLEIAIIGGGRLKDAVRARVDGSGFAGRFHLQGPRSAPEIGEWLGAANLLCLPSYSEGCPNVVVEALSSGRPVVATDVGGIPELVDESTGILVAPRDAQALQSALTLALDRTWDQAHIARTAGRTWDQAAKETLAVCRRVVDEAGGR